MEEVTKKEEMVMYINDTINVIDGLLSKIYTHKSFELDEIKIILSRLVSTIEVYINLNKSYKFDILTVGIDNINTFIKTRDYILLIDALEFEIKSSLIEMKFLL